MTTTIRIRKTLKGELNGRLLFFIDRPDAESEEKNLYANLRSVTEDPLTDAEMQILAGCERGNRLVKGQVFLWPGASDWRELWDEDGSQRYWEQG